MRSVLGAMPHYGQIHAGAGKAFWWTPARRNRFVPHASTSSLLAE